MSHTQAIEPVEAIRAVSPKRSQDARIPHVHLAANPPPQPLVGTDYRPTSEVRSHLGQAHFVGFNGQPSPAGDEVLRLKVDFRGFGSTARERTTSHPSTSVASYTVSGSVENFPSRPDLFSGPALDAVGGDPDAQHTVSRALASMPDKQRTLRGSDQNMDETSETAWADPPTRAFHEHSSAITDSSHVLDHPDQNQLYGSNKRTQNGIMIDGGIESKHVSSGLHEMRHSDGGSSDILSEDKYGSRDGLFQADMNGSTAGRPLLVSNPGRVRENLEPICGSVYDVDGLPAADPAVMCVFLSCGAGPLRGCSENISLRQVQNGCFALSIYT